MKRPIVVKTGEMWDNNPLNFVVAPMKLVVFMPAYNEQESIAKVIENIKSVLNSKEIAEQFDETAVAVLNDNSKDNTKEIAAKAGAIVFDIRGESKGVGRVFKKGVDNILSLKPTIAVSIDADGQFDPNDIPRLIKPILDGKADLVTGSKFTDRTNPPVGLKKSKLKGNYVVVGLVNFLLGSNFTDVSCGFRAYNIEALANLNVWGDRTYVQESIMDLFFKGLSIVEVPIEAKYINIRPSRVFRFGGGILSYGLRTAGILLMAVRDYRAMRLFGKVGLYSIIFAAILSAFFFGHYLFTSSFSPYLFVGFLSGMFFMFGFAMVLVGLIADMMSRIRINQERNIYYQRLRVYYNEK